MRHLQDKVENFCQQHNLSKSVEARFLDVVSELGELAKEILLNSNYGKKTIENSERLEEEIGDTIFSLIALSNSVDIDMEVTVTCSDVVICDLYIFHVPGDIIYYLLTRLICMLDGRVHIYLGMHVFVIGGHRYM